MLRTASCAVAALLFAGASPASAAFIQSTTGITNPAVTITFTEVVLPQGTPLTNQYAALGVTFSNLFYDPQPVMLPNQVPPQAGNFSVNGNPGVNPVSIVFTSPQTSAALVVASNPAMTTFTALNNGVVVETAMAPTTATQTPNDFYGFTGIILNEIQVLTAASNGAVLIDNIQLGQAPAAPATAPEPAALTLLAVGAVGLAGRRLRNRPAAAG